MTTGSSPWYVRSDRHEVRFEHHLLRDLTPDESDAVREAAARYGSFLGRAVALHGLPT